MGMIIDQTWVSSWTSGLPTASQLSHIANWVMSTPRETHELLCVFPPLAVVKGKRRDMEVPYPWTVGIVSSYHPDNKIGVRQEPTADEVLVNADDLEVVGFWKSFNPLSVASLLNRAHAPL